MNSRRTIAHDRALKAKLALQDEMAKVAYRIEHEGFDFSFADYSDWREVKDPKFHALRRAYLKAMRALKSHVRKVSKSTYPSMR